MRVLPAFALAAALVLAAGCGSTSAPEGAPSTAAEPPGRDCLAWWNTAGNKDNRARLVETGYRVGSVSGWTAEAAGDGSASEGCGYLFHDDDGYVSFSAHWEGDRLVWDPNQTQTGPWSPEQELGGYSSSHLVADDGAVRLDPDWEPPTQEELAGPLAKAPRGGRDELPDLEGGPPREPYQPLATLVLSGADHGLPTGCSAENIAGLLDRFFDAFDRGDADALAGFFGPGFQYYVHPREVEQPEPAGNLVAYLLERRAENEQMSLLAVRVDTLEGDGGPFAGTVEADVALVFRTATTLAPHWIGALVDCRTQTLVNFGYRSYGLDLISDEIVAHASCPPEGPPVKPGHRVACARVTDLDARLDL